MGKKIERHPMVECRSRICLVPIDPVGRCDRKKTRGLVQADTFMVLFYFAFAGCDAAFAKLMPPDKQQTAITL
jgi:hypothetical protein